MGAAPRPPGTKRPRLIARCADTADVIAAVNFGRAQGLALAVRGGGHNGAGFAACDEGLVIDLSRLRGVRVDPVKRTIRAAGGCTLGVAGAEGRWAAALGLAGMLTVLARRRRNRSA